VPFPVFHQRWLDSFLCLRTVECFQPWSRHSLIVSISASKLYNIVINIGIAGYGKVADVPGAAPRKVVMNTRNSHIPGSQSVKIRYGPYKVPSVTHKNFLGESGSLFNYPDLQVERPCTGDCVLLGLNADLEYADGSNANVGNGMWLHHMVLFNSGPNRFDPTCVGKTSLPHLLIGSDPGKSERLMASGNERTSTRFNSPYNPGEKLGYYMSPTDKFSFIVDFMNENKEDKIVYMTMTYDFIDGRPEGFSNFRSIWLDVAQCGTSEIRPPKESGTFAVSQDWTANLNADILGAGGHLHDGGDHLTLMVDGKEVCDSVATYGVTPPNNGTKSAGGMGGMGMGAMSRAIDSISRLASIEGFQSLTKRDGPGGMDMPHITRMSFCSGKTMGITQVKKGQKWKITGYYDYDKHSGMKANGHQSNVMGISIMMVKNWTA
jgi:hypothetical protein